MNALSKLSLEILQARRARDMASTPADMRLANIRVAAAFEAWRTVAQRNQ